MKKIILLFLLSFITFIAHCQTTFNKLYSPYGNNPNTSFGSSSIVAKGNDYIIATGGFDTLYNNYQCLHFYKLDTLGNLTKLHSFLRDSINYYFSYSSLIQTHDGGYLYASDMDDPSSTDGNTIHFMIRFDQNMDTLWTKIMPHDTIWEAIRQVRTTSDNGFIFVGSRNISPSDDIDVLLIKADSLGNQLWRKIIPIANIGGGSGILEAPDKGFLINGYSASYTYKDGNPFLMKTDSAGNVIWTKYVGGNEYDGSGSMAITHEGDYLFAYGYSTYTYPFNESWSARLNIIKYAPDGAVIWNRMYDTIRNHLGACKIQVLPNNDFIVMGSHAQPTQGYSYSFFPSFLFKFNANGDSLWRKIYYMKDEFGDENLLADNVLNADGNITACGWVNAWSQTPYQQIWLLKTDSTGYAPGPQNVSIIDLPYLYVGYGGLKIYPNPAKEFIILSYAFNENTNSLQLLISNALGKKVYSKALSKAKDELLITLKGYATGNYIATIFKGGKAVKSSKFVVE